VEDRDDQKGLRKKSARKENLKISFIATAVLSTSEERYCAAGGT